MKFINCFLFWWVTFALLDPDTDPDNNKLFLWQDFLVLFRKTLEDPEEDVCFYTIVALTHFVRRYRSSGLG
jgi:hypothetical protein